MTDPVAIHEEVKRMLQKPDISRWGVRSIAVMDITREPNGQLSVVVQVELVTVSER